MSRLASRVLEQLQPLQMFKYITDATFNPVLSSVFPDGGRWTDGYQFDIGFSNNPFLTAPSGGSDFDRYRVNSALLTAEITNTNKYDVVFTAYHVIVRRTTDRSVNDILASPQPGGLGTLYNDPYANPFDCHDFPRYYKVYKVRSYKLKPGESRVIKQVCCTLRKGRTASPIDFQNTTRYIKGITTGIVIHARGMLMTGTEATLSAQNISLGCHYIGCRFKYDITYRVLKNQGLSNAYATNYDNTGASRNVGMDLTNVNPTG